MAERIIIPELPQVKHESDFYRPGFLSMTIIGKSGCGKTQLLCNILPGISKSIKTLLIATAIKDVPVHNAIVSWFNAKNPPVKANTGARTGVNTGARTGVNTGARTGVNTGARTGVKQPQRPEYYARVINDPEELRSGVEMMAEIGMVSFDKPGLLIFDDFNIGCAHGPHWDMIVHAFTKLRNSGWHFIILAQQPQFLPTIVRNCTTARVLFDCNSHTALDTFARDHVDRVPDPQAFKMLMRYIHAVPYTYIMVREKPFDVVVGKGGDIRPVMNEHAVMAPTYHEILREMSVSNGEELDKKSAQLQTQAGNTSSVVQAKLKP